MKSEVVKLIDPCAFYNQKMSEITAKIEGKIGMAASVYTTMTNQVAGSADFAAVLDSVQETESSSGLSDYYLNSVYENNSIYGTNGYGNNGLSAEGVLGTLLNGNYAYTGLGGSIDGGVLESAIQNKSSIYNIDANLVKAVIKAESNFNSSAVSGAGAIGLMQLMPATAKALGVQNPYDAVQNLDGGIRYLKTQIENFGGNVKMALAAYNCGPSKLKSLNITNIDDPAQFARLPKETQNYVNKIIGYMK